MVVDVIMPQLGESVVEGTLVKWLKKEGDWVKRDESIAAISTAKIDTELPSPATGTLVKILVKEGETVKVGTIIAQIETEAKVEVKVPEEIVPEEIKVLPLEEVKLPPKEAFPPVIPIRPEIRKRSSPLVRRIAKEEGINIEEIEGTGLNGRVTKKDILAYLEKRKWVKPEAPPPPPPKPPFVPAEKKLEEIIPLTIMRKTIAEHMVRSKRTSPHVTSVMEVDMTEIVKFREKIKEDFRKKEGIDITFLPFIIVATIEGLKQFPILNSSWSDEGIIVKKYINMGIAVALEDGLIVPVIKKADEKSLLGLTRELHDMAERARNKKLTPDDVHGGTFTITNPGSFGTILGTPIINQPQAAILGVEAIVKRPVVIDDAIAIRSMMNLCLSYDHRILDGAAAAQFLKAVKSRLEDFNFSLL